MTSATRCPKCGNILSDDLGGKCPQCMLQAAMAGSSVGGDGPETVDYGGIVAGKPANGKAAVIPQAGQDFGDYHIVRALGQGGMGSVFEAEERGTGRRLALKVLNHSLDSPAARQRFLREGRSAATITHPNSVYVFGTDEVDGAPIITMELVKGGTLQDLVRAHGPMPVGDAVDAILQVIDGLEAAHAAGVLHRDVKPSNCFVDADGMVKIGDYGLSVSKVGRGDMQITASGVILGTPAFASPEQLRGDELDLRSDIYAVGCTLYYLLVGKIPFDADNMVKLVATVLEKAAPDVRTVRGDVPKELAAVIARSLEKDPTRRYRTYAELRAALLPFSSLVPSPAPPARRYAGGAIDTFTYMSMNHLVGLIVALLGYTTLTFSTTRAVAGILGGIAVWFLYYTLPEAIFGATLGKWLMGLRIVRPGTMQPPGLARASLRSAIYYAIPSLPIWLYTAFGPSMVDAEGQLDFTLGQAFAVMGIVYLAIPLWAMLFVTMRRGNGYAAVHDLAAGVRVVVRPSAAARPTSQTGAEPSPTTDGSPAFGPYHVLAPLGSNSAGEWKLGYDARLLRKVWLRILPAGAEPLPAEIQSLSRWGRIRWLTGRRDTAGGTQNWDAFEAPAGQPLWNRLDRPSDWDEVRYWLLDLAEELTAALKDNSLPATLSLDRVWITADGRAKLSDLPLPGLSSAAPSIATRRGAVEPVREFINQVAAAALMGERPSAEEAKSETFARPLPLHARPVLNGLLKVQRPAVIAAELRANLQRPAVVSRARRWGMFFAAMLAPAAFGFIGLISTAPTYIAMLQNPEAEQLKNALYQLNDPFGFRKNTPEVKAALEVYIVGTYGDRIKDPEFWKSRYVAFNILPDQVKLAKDLVERIPTPTPEELNQAAETIEPVLHLKDDPRALFRGPMFPLLVALMTVSFWLWFEGVPSIIAAFFGGGPLWRVFSLIPVTADGRPASAWRFAWRQLVAWSPVLAAPIVFAMVTPLALMAPPIIAGGTFVAIAVLLIGAIVVSTFVATRSWPDRIAGTWLVTR